MVFFSLEGLLFAILTWLTDLSVVNHLEPFCLHKVAFVGHIKRQKMVFRLKG